MEEVSLVGEIRGFFLSVFCARARACMNVFFQSSIKQTICWRGGVETYRDTNRGRKGFSRKRENKHHLLDRGIRESRRKAMKEEVRLRDGKEWAQGGLSLSYFHFSVQPWLYQERFAEFRHMRYKKILQICLHSSPQYLAFIHPISTNKPILSTLTVGFIPSTTQSACTKHNIHTGTGVQIYTHTHTQNLSERKAWTAQIEFLFILKWKNNPNFLGSLICLRPDKHSPVIRQRTVWASSGEDLCLEQCRWGWRGFWVHACMYLYEELAWSQSPFI